MTFIDLFAGIGGIRLGFEQAGYECVFSSEIDNYAQDTYALNFGDRPFGDITKIHAEDIPDHTVLTGGFPCQPFSIAGVSKYNALGYDHGFNHDTKGTLFFDIERILRAKRPKAFLLENVKNLKSHDQGQTFKVIENILRNDLGYHVVSKVIDASSLVPQHRERVYIVGFDKPNDFEFPKLKDKKPVLRSILEERVDPKYTLSDHLWQYLQDYARKHREKGNGFGFGLADLDGRSRTLSARYYKDGAEILIPQEGANPRRLTPKECARLMGFPKSFKWTVSDTRAYQQFGNSVVVPVIKVIAAAMAPYLNEECPPTPKRNRSTSSASVKP
jgi:DNA (cytosine-5)-methyltransferase 1